MTAYTLTALLAFAAGVFVTWLYFSVAIVGEVLEADWEVGE